MLGYFRASPKVVEVSHGEFVCPHCRRTTAFKHKEHVRRGFFLFVPFLGDTIAEYVECQICRQRFPLDVLRSKLSPDVAQVLDNLKAKLQSGTSIEEAESLLIKAGIDLPTVGRCVSVAAGIGHKQCPRCNLTFRDEVLKCHKCGHVLPAKSV